MIFPDLPFKAISVRQPWAALIVCGVKDIENRPRVTHFRGEVAIHASLQVDKEAMADLEDGINPATGLEFTMSELLPVQSMLLETAVALRGGILGSARITDCVQQSDSDWFFGPYGYALEDQKCCDFIPVKGALGLFDWRRNLPEAS